MLHLSLFGVPEIRHGEHLLKFHTRKAQALLIFLLVEQGMHARATLTNMLWPESDPAHGRTALRVALNHLREALNRVDQPQPYLTAESDLLGFNLFAPLEADVYKVQAAFSTLALPDTTENSDRLAELRMASTAYRGDFLENFALADAPLFDNWASTQREKYYRWMEAVFQQLCLIYLRDGAAQAATDQAARWVARHPLSERAYRILMQSYARQGKRVEALQAYERCRQVLADELHIRLSAETVALAERIRHATSTDYSSQIVVRKAERLDARAFVLDLPFVARQDEFAQLIDAFYAAAASDALVTVIQGEAGVGKTRLCMEFLRWALAQGAEILQGRAFEAGGSVPYQVLIDPLRKRIAAINAPEDLLDDIWLAELSRLLPELRERYPDLPQPGSDGSTAQARLFEAVTQFLRALSQDRPVLLFVDDLQWTDLATLDAVQYLVNRCRELAFPLLVLFSLRAEAIDMTKSLASWLSGLRRIAPMLTIELTPFTPEQTGLLVQTLSDDPTDTMKAFSQWLYSETGGQPFYIVEMVKALLEGQHIHLQATTAGSPIIHLSAGVDTGTLTGLIPSGIREVMLSSLGRLSSAATSLLSAAAVIGREFGFEMLCGISGLDEDRGLNALEELLAHRVIHAIPLREQGRTSGELYSFVHDKIRDAIYQDLNSTRRRIFHRRAFEQLGQKQAAPAILAHHAHAAHLTALAIQYHWLAGEEALRLYAVTDAIASYQQALLLWEQSRAARAIPLVNQGVIDQGSTEDIMRYLLLQLGRAYELRADFAAAKQTYERLLEYARELADNSIECQTLNRLATLAVHHSLSFREAFTFLEKARDVARRSGDMSSLAESEWNTAQLKFYSRGMDAPIYAARALQLAQELDQPDLLAHCLNISAMTSLAAGNSREAYQFAMEACAIYRRLGNHALEADSLCVAANAEIYMGHARAAVGTARDAYQISTQISNVWGQINSQLQMAVALREIGSQDEALDTIAQAVDAANRHHVFIQVLWAMAVYGNICRVKGDLAQAMDIHKKALDLAVSTEITPFNELLHAELCADYANQSDWHAAANHARQSLRIRTNLFHSYIGLTYWADVEALLRAGDVWQVEQDLAAFGLRINNSRRYQIPYWRAAAKLAEYKGQRVEALMLAQQALQLALELDLPAEAQMAQNALDALSPVL